MERTRVRSRSPILNGALIVLAILIVIYIPVRVRLERSERAREAPAGGASVSIFFTSRLAGYREPCG